ncbi:hypothetical protein B0J14DRAFT_255479 [Halenospora varia]|nr:hypothetical protein B0J14DRAFT_255479 [Halenospora varia]
MVSLANQFASTPESPLGLAMNEVEDDLHSKTPKSCQICMCIRKKKRGGITSLSPKMPATFQAISNTIISLSSARNIWGSISEREAKFRGQLYVSRALEKLLGDDYSPQMHWTSDLRGQAGEPHYQTAISIRLRSQLPTAPASSRTFFLN